MPFCALISTIWVLVVLPLPIFGVVSLLVLSVGVKLYLIMTLICISLMTKDVENLFMCLIHISSSVKFLFKSFAIFWIDLYLKHSLLPRLQTWNPRAHLEFTWPWHSGSRHEERPGVHNRSIRIYLGVRLQDYASVANCVFWHWTEHLDKEQNFWIFHYSSGSQPWIQIRITWGVLIPRDSDLLVTGRGTAWALGVVKVFRVILICSQGWESLF